MPLRSSLDWPIEVHFLGKDRLPLFPWLIRCYQASRLDVRSGLKHDPVIHRPSNQESRADLTPLDPFTILMNGHFVANPSPINTPIPVPYPGVPILAQLAQVSTLLGHCFQKLLTSFVFSTILLPASQRLSSISVHCVFVLEGCLPGGLGTHGPDLMRQKGGQLASI